MVVILGAGIAGLASAYRLDEFSVPYSIYEKDLSSGGLLRNFTIDGFRFDQAIHLSFAKEAEVREIFDQTKYYVHQPESKCSYNGLWLRHPVQNNLAPLPDQEKIAIIESFANRGTAQVENYKDWLNFQYGDVFTKTFPAPYTRKYWDAEPEHLGIEWIGERMSRPNIRQVLEGAFNQEIPNHYYAKEMRYPEQGGYISFLDPIMNKIGENITFDHCVESLDIKQKVVRFRNGIEAPFDQLISSIPLPVLISSLSGLPKEVMEAAKRLEWTRVHLVSIGFNKPVNLKDLWFYIYDDDILAARAYSPSLKSLDNVPHGCSSIQFEIYESSKNSTRYQSVDLVKNCVDGLEKLKIASQDDIQLTDHRVLEYGNVTFYREMETDRDYIVNWLMENGITLAGRFGEWDYLWSNQAMMSGFRAADSVINNID